MGVFLILFMLASAGSGYLIHREWKRSEEATRQRLAAMTKLEDSLSRTKRLEGFISICMHCKKIHNGRDAWEQLEKYISNHSDAQFSHGICPECLKKMYPGYEEKAQE